MNVKDKDKDCEVVSMQLFNVIYSCISCKIFAKIPFAWHENKQFHKTCETILAPFEGDAFCSKNYLLI